PAVRGTVSIVMNGIMAIRGKDIRTRISRILRARLVTREVIPVRDKKRFADASVEGMRLFSCDLPFLPRAKGKKIC
ncbi:MAG TPA: hypothetical protein PLL75_07445, partial [Candidatus Omnitrophota bacterium]|nr:hypothetical protein [Candidatus Omnitrophota bacterium]